MMEIDEGLDGVIKEHLWWGGMAWFGYEPCGCLDGRFYY